MSPFTDCVHARIDAHQGGSSRDVISARIDHASPSITLDLYTHLMPGMGRQAVELFEEMLGAQR